MGDHYETSYVKAGRGGRNPRLCVTYHDGDGRRRERTKSAKPKRDSALRREAEEWRAELNREWEEDRERREREEEASRLPMLSDYLGDFIVDRRAEGIQPSTVRAYQRDREVILDPDGGLSGLRIGEVGPRELRAWMRHMLSVREMAPVSVSRAMTFLKQAIARAETERLIPWSGIDRVRGPRVPRERPNSLDRESMSRLREWVTEDTDWFRAAVAIALYTGMRRGEVCALRWKDVDLDGRIVRVRHAIGKGPDGTYLKRPKNGKARKFGLPVDLERVLRGRRERVIAELLDLYPDDVAQERLGRLYICGEIDGTWREPDLVTYRWEYWRKRLDIHGLERERCPFHDLRHTFITYMLLAGVPVKNVSGMVGHTSAAMTLDVYASEDVDEIVRMAGSIGAALPGGAVDDGDDSEPTYELPAASE